MGKSSGKFRNSFINAARGIRFLFNSQHNARIEWIVTVLVIVAGILFRIRAVEWVSILVCIALVLGLEGLNTALEILADKLHPGIDSEIGKVKDVAAGAVLIVSIVAAIIGFIIFAPRLMELFLT